MHSFLRSVILALPVCAALLFAVPCYGGGKHEEAATPPAGGVPIPVIDISGALDRMDQTISAAEQGFTPEDRYFIGRAVAAHILHVYRPYNREPALTAYLNLICNSLTVNSPAPGFYNGYHVMILDDPGPAAFSTPGGHIFLSKGIVDLASSEDMLAAVIAHEIAHIQLNHGVKEIEHDMLIRSLGQEQSRISSLSDQFAEPVNEMVNVLFAKGYSQLQETEADSYAIMLLASAGYDPQSLVQVMRIFESLQPNQKISLETSHPLASQRVNSAIQEAARHRIADTRFAREDRFCTIMDRD